MKPTIKWYGHYSPIAAFRNNQILAYRNGWLYIINENGTKKKDVKLSFSLFDSIKECNRLFIRLFRRNIRTSCITENGNVYFFIGKCLYYYRNHTAKKIYNVPQDKSTPLNIVPGISGTKYQILWGDYFTNDNREEVYIWGLRDGMFVEIVYTFPPNSIRHIHNIVPTHEKTGYYIFTGDNDKLAGIYYADAGFNEVIPVFVGKQQSRAVQGFSTKRGLIFATDSVVEQNYLFLLKKEEEWSISKIQKINGSCIYAIENSDTFYFSTTVESPEVDNQNRLIAMLSTKRGSGILSDIVEVLAVNKDLDVKKIVEFEKDCFPYKLFQYGSVIFPASKSRNLVIYPIGVKKWDGQLGILQQLDV